MVAITATLVGTSVPRAVQVVVTGLTVGEAYAVTGEGAGVQWPVRAGSGVADASQVVRTDLATPVNVALTYTVVADTGTAVSAPVTVDYAGKYVMQSLDGTASAVFRWLDNGAPREMGVRVAAFAIPGRTTPVVAFDVPSGESGELLVSTGGVETAALRALIRRAGPVLVRTDGNVRDLAPVEYLVITRAGHALTGEGIQSTNVRHWNLSYVVVDDPEPGTVVTTSSGDDFDTVYALLTGADFDAEWADQTWDDFDTVDWATRADA